MVEETMEYWIEQQDMKALEEDFKANWKSSGYDVDSKDFMLEYEVPFYDYIYQLYQDSLKLREQCLNAI